MPLLISERRLRGAALACMRRHSARGADGVSWADYRHDLPARISALSAALRDGSWRPGPLRQVAITSYSGKTFPAVVPTVEDRIVHRALRAAVEPVLEAAAFRDWVSGWRPGRSRVTAVRGAAAYLATGRPWVADVDVRQASEGPGTEQVIGWLAEHVMDGSFLDRFRAAMGGLPGPLIPGTGFHPLLLNLRLSRADALLGSLAVVRFADNYCAFAACEPGAREAFAVISRALAAEGMGPHKVKSRIRAFANAEDLFLIEG